MNWWGGNFVYLVQVKAVCCTTCYQTCTGGTCQIQLLIINLYKFLTLISTLELHIKRNKAPSMLTGNFFKGRGGIDWWNLFIHLVTTSVCVLEGTQWATTTAMPLFLPNVYSLYFNSTFLQGYNKGLCIYCCKQKNSKVIVQE